MAAAAVSSPIACLASSHAEALIPSMRRTSSAVVIRSRQVCTLPRLYITISGHALSTTAKGNTFLDLAHVIQHIDKTDDIAGLKVAVSSGTNQEEIPLRWSKANEAKGLKPTEISYYDDEAVQDLTLASGRIDAYFGPNSTSAFKAARDGKTRLVGTFSGGWPVTAEIAVTTKKGAGLADAITAALNAQIENGNYAKVLARWSLSAEAVTESDTNPPGLPKS